MTFNQGSFKRGKSYSFNIGEMAYPIAKNDFTIEDIYVVTTEENKKQDFTKQEFGLFFRLEKKGA